MLNSLFYNCPDFNTFKTLKFASDDSNTSYFTYSSNTSIFGNPDVKWDQIVFVIEDGLIYTRGQIFTNFNEILNELNLIKSELNNIDLTLSSEYTYSSYTNAQLSLNSGDSFETAFGKLEKAIIDNEYVISSSLTYINGKINDINNSSSNIVVSTYITENDENPVSGGAVYSKFEDLIGTAPAALDTLGEISTALNNDANLAATLTNQITSKIPKVSNPIPGNFAYFNSDGTIADSTYNYNTFLTEHQSIKTVNNESLVGTGNIVVSGLPQVSASDNGKILMVVNGQWQLVSPSMLYSGTALPNDAYGRNGDIYIQTEEQEEP